jgi:hypothetical protein
MDAGHESVFTSIKPPYASFSRRTCCNKTNKLKSDDDDVSKVGLGDERRSMAQSARKSQCRAIISIAKTTTDLNNKIHWEIHFLVAIITDLLMSDATYLRQTSKQKKKNQLTNNDDDAKATRCEEC